MHRTLCDFLADLYQNAVESGAQTIRLELEQDEQSFTMTVADDGCGMTEDELVRAQDPFYTDGTKHRQRKVGLGLPFVVQTVQMTGGSFRMESTKRREGQPTGGTLVQATFNCQHWDTPPMGDLPATLSQLMAWAGDHEAVVVRRLVYQGQAASWDVKRSQLRQALGDLEDLEALTLMRDFFRSAEQSINGGET